MKKLISESEKSKIRKMNSIEEGWFSDAVDAIKLILDKGETNSIYNVSNGEPLLFKDLIEYAKELIGGEGELRPIEVPEFHRIVQVHSQWMKNDKLKALGYEPKYDMKSIIEDMVR